MAAYCGIIGALIELAVARVGVVGVYALCPPWLFFPPSPVAIVAHMYAVPSLN